MQKNLRTALLAAGACTMLAGGIAFAQQDQNPPPRMEMHGQEHGREGGPMGGAMHEGWRAILGLRIAERLNTLHTYLGITPEQQTAWDAFAQAVIAMVPADGGPHDMARIGAFEGIDRMTQHMQTMAQNAQKLDQAAQALKAVLTPDQIKKADEVWAARMEDREHHWHEWMHRWLHHDDHGAEHDEGGRL